ncbi:hypothetical protein VTP01DRAFT_3904 [Rhizomucor pusillus]|uniref:uncharacterized protein n=1 Tax=Rhizomucor pusillus TaxID=4840 RepID=UPI0037439F9B
MFTNQISTDGYAVHFQLARAAKKASIDLKLEGFSMSEIEEYFSVCSIDPGRKILKRREARGKAVIVTIDKYRTSQVCHSCLARSLRNVTTEDSISHHGVLDCQNCGMLWNRDVNASKNMYYIASRVWQDLAARNHSQTNIKSTHHCECDTRKSLGFYDGSVTTALHGKFEPIWFKFVLIVVQFDAPNAICF